MRKSHAILLAAMGAATMAAVEQLPPPDVNPLPPDRKKRRRASTSRRLFPKRGKVLPEGTKATERRRRQIERGTLRPTP